MRLMGDCKQPLVLLGNKGEGVLGREDLRVRKSSGEDLEKAKLPETTVEKDRGLNSSEDTGERTVYLRREQIETPSNEQPDEEEPAERQNGRLQHIPCPAKFDDPRLKILTDSVVLAHSQARMRGQRTGCTRGNTRQNNGNQQSGEHLRGCRLCASEHTTTQCSMDDNPCQFEATIPQFQKWLSPGRGAARPLHPPYVTSAGSATLT